MKSLESIVKKAIGYDEERGDQVEVVTMPFNLALPEEEPKTETESPWKGYLLTFYKPAVSVVLALLFLLFVVKRGPQQTVLRSPGGEDPASAGSLYPGGRHPPWRRRLRPNPPPWTTNPPPSRTRR